jgi:tyrosine-protein phosphatase SIW14
MSRLFLIIAFFLGSLAQAEIQRFIELEEGKIYRGSQPTEDQDYRLLKSLGVKTIVNLRWDTSVEKSKEMAKKYGFKFINLPMKASEWPNNETVDTALKNIKSRAHQPVFLHCQHGKDRTGLIAALYRVETQKWEPNDARQEWIGMGFSVKWLRELDKYFLQRTGQ